MDSDSGADPVNWTGAGSNTLDAGGGFIDEILFFEQTAAIYQKRPAAIYRASRVYLFMYLLLYK